MTTISTLPNMSSPETNDLFATVDVNDLTEAATGTTKKMSFATFKAFLTSLVMAPANFKPSAPTATASTTLIHAGFGGAGTPVVITPLSSGVIQINGVGQMYTNTAVAQTGVSGRYGQLAGPATTVASGSNGGEISAIASWSSPSAGKLDIASSTGWNSAGGSAWVVASGSTIGQIAYTGVAAGQLTGCTYVTGSATGTVATGNAVTGYPPQGAAVAGTAWGNNGTFILPPAAAIAQGLPFSFTDLLSLTPNLAYWFDLVYETGTGADTAQPKNISLVMWETS